MKLYTYFRSSAAYRARIALNLKGVSYEMASIHLTRGGGQQHGAEYRAVNPQGRVPALALDNGDTLIQSLAIIEYLEEAFPTPPLLPSDPAARAHVRALAHVISCDIHPLNNTSPLFYLKNTLKHDQETINAWYAHWVTVGFEAVEALLRPGPYAFGDKVTIADVCLVPQVANARRFNVPLDRFPQIIAVDAACLRLPAFDKARPDNQPDKE